MKILIALLSVILAFSSCNKSEQKIAEEGLPVKEEEANNAFEMTGLVGLNGASRIVKSGTKYFWYSTGGGIRMRWSSNPESGVWSPGPDVFPVRPSFWATYSPMNAPWAPDVIYDAASGQYRMYYCVSKLGSTMSAIGLATNTTLDPAATGYAWVDRGIVVSTPAGHTWNALDPCPVITPSGDRFLCLGSHFSGIKLIQLGDDGKKHPTITNMWNLARKNTTPLNNPIEAGSIYPGTKNGVEGFWLYVNWGTGLNHEEKATYEVHIGWSTTISGPYLDKAGVDMYDGGGTVFMPVQQTFTADGSTRIGRGHVGILKGHQLDGAHPDWVSYSYWLKNPPAGQDGKRFGLQQLITDEDGWPRDGMVFRKYALN